MESSGICADVRIELRACNFKRGARFGELRLSCFQGLVGNVDLFFEIVELLILVNLAAPVSSFPEFPRKRQARRLWALRSWDRPYSRQRTRQRRERRLHRAKIVDAPCACGATRRF
jgi:hypothetical protein